MRFTLSEEQQSFSDSIDKLLSDSDTRAAEQAWAEGEHAPGLAIWRGLARLGVTALAVPEQWDGIGAEPIDLVVALERIGYHAVPGPWVDSAAVLPVLADASALAERWLPALAAGDLLASIAAPPDVPYPLDADVASARLVMDGTQLSAFTPLAKRASADPARRLFDFEVSEHLSTRPDTARASNFGALGTAAVVLGAGQWLLETSVEYAKQREQYGHPIGSYQAIKHLLADVVTKIELARPLLYGAAVSLAEDATSSARDTSAAKVAAADAAHLAARTGLQVHGAIGYTAEHPLGSRLAKVRALIPAWGTQAVHRSRILNAITSGKRAS